MIHGIDHTAISVPDMDRALAFYAGLLGFEVLFQFEWPAGAEALDKLIGLEQSSAKVAMLQLGEAQIEIFEFQSPEPAPQAPKRPVNDHGITHICLRVSDLDSEYERLSQAGIRFNSAPLDTGAAYCVYGRDPFGNTFELIEPKGG